MARQVTRQISSEMGAAHPSLLEGETDQHEPILARGGQIYSSIAEREHLPLQVWNDAA